MSSNKNLQTTTSWLTSTLTSLVHFISYVHATNAQDNQLFPPLIIDTDLQISSNNCIAVQLWAQVVQLLLTVKDPFQLLNESRHT